MGQFRGCVDLNLLYLCMKHVQIYYKTKNLTNYTVPLTLYKYIMCEKIGIYDIVKKRISDWIENGHYTSYLDLSRLGLTEIPELPTNIQRLWLQGNKIQNIYTLPSSLTILDVRNNELEFIYASLPENLTDLFVSNNKMKCLPYLPDSLERLNISYNNINTLPNIPRNLKYLYCWNNPVPFELIESDNLSMYDIVEESHKERIKLWKKFIKM